MKKNHTATLSLIMHPQHEYTQGGLDNALRILQSFIIRSP